MKRTAVPVSEIAWPFFFLGAGFMLMESQIVSRMALLFGTTWLVNSITISGLLLLIVGRQHAGARRLAHPDAGRLCRPVRDHSDRLFRAGLGTAGPNRAPARSRPRSRCCAVRYSSPASCSSARSPRRASAARRWARTCSDALVGGLLESLSMWIGLRSLLFLALALYLLAYWFASRKPATAPVRHEEALALS